MELKIKDSAAKELIKNMFIEHPNVPQAVDMLFATCTDNILSSMLEILLSDKTYVPFTKGAWVVSDLDGYHSREFGDQAILKDMNLMEGEKFIGYIENSSNYGEEFHAYHEQMEVKSFICTSEGKIEQKVKSIYTSKLSLILNKKSIKRLNDIKNNLV